MRLSLGYVLRRNILLQGLLLCSFGYVGFSLGAAKSIKSEECLDKKLLLVGSPVMVATSLLQYLHEAHWQVHFVTDYKEAIKYMLRERPWCAAISLEHPAKQFVKVVPYLPKFLGIHILPFVESIQRPEEKLKLEKQYKHVIFPPLTGVALERALFKLFLDRLDLDTSVLENGNFEEGLRRLGVSSHKDPDGEWSLRFPNKIRLNAEPMSEANESYKEIMTIIGDAAPLTSLKNLSGMGLEKTKSAASEMVKQAEFAEIKSGVSAKEHKTAIENLDQCTQTALSESCKGDAANAVKMNTTEDLTCIIVDSNKFSGYLIAAQANKKPIDKVFIDNVKRRLSAFLKDRGEEVSADDSLDITVKEVEFQPWALDCAGFLRKAVHEGQEIAMAFFPYTRAKIAYAEVTHTHDEMELLSIPLTEMRSDETVDFNVYLYFPANDKYILYTPKGSRFHGNQKERLVRAGVAELFASKDSQSQVDQYRAKVFLNSSIEDFQRKKKS